MLLLRTYSFRYYSPSTSIRLQSNEITLWSLDKKYIYWYYKCYPKKVKQKQSPVAMCLVPRYTRCLFVPQCSKVLVGRMWSATCGLLEGVALMNSFNSLRLRKMGYSGFARLYWAASTLFPTGTLLSHFLPQSLSFSLSCIERLSNDRLKGTANGSACGSGTSSIPHITYDSRNGGQWGLNIQLLLNYCQSCIAFCHQSNMFVIKNSLVVAD